MGGGGGKGFAGESGRGVTGARPPEYGSGRMRGRHLESRFAVGAQVYGAQGGLRKLNGVYRLKN